MLAIRMVSISNPSFLKSLHQPRDHLSAGFANSCYKTRVFRIMRRDNFSCPFWTEVVESVGVLLLKDILKNGPDTVLCIHCYADPAACYDLGEQDIPLQRGGDVQRATGTSANRNETVSSCRNDSSKAFSVTRHQLRPSVRILLLPLLIRSPVFCKRMGSCCNTHSWTVLRSHSCNSHLSQL